MKIRRYIEVEIEDLGARIKQAREADGRPVEKLALEADMTRSHWHGIESERGGKTLPEQTLRKIEKALGIDFGVRFDS